MNQLHPGVYVVDSLPKDVPTRPVGAAIPGFVGIAEKGPINTATYITSWAHFVREFGSFLKDAYLAYAVRSYFANGGTVCWVTRVSAIDEQKKIVAKTATATATDGGEPGVVVLEFAAPTPGTWGNDLGYSITAQETTYTLTLYENGIKIADYLNCTPATAESKVVDALIKITVKDKVTMPAATEGIVKLTGGSNGDEGITDNDFIGDPAIHSGLYAFDAIKGAVNISIPGGTTVSIHNAITSYVGNDGFRFGILDAPMGKTPTEMAQYKATINSSKYAAIYYPWITALDPIGEGKTPTILLPPSGHIAGVYSKINATRGIAKAPAGVETALGNAIGLEWYITDAEQDILDPISVNCIRLLDNEGIVVWGNNCLDGTQINHQLLQIYIKTWFDANFKWVVFEPIDDRILGPSGLVTMTGNAFMSRLLAEGAFDEAAPMPFFVQCDRENNPKEQTDNNHLQIDVGYARKGLAKMVTISIGITR